MSLPGTFRRILPITLLLGAAWAVWSQQVNEAELGSATGRTPVFLNNDAAPTVVQSAGEILGIGEVLARTVGTSGRGDYFGKYTVIRAFDAGETALLNADILVLGAAARVTTIGNVQRIVAGYLEASFGYPPAQARDLAVLVTAYNASYRGNIAALSGKYSARVMANLSAENAGISLRYSEWPGRTRLIIPLGGAAGSTAQGRSASASTGQGGTTPAAAGTGTTRGASTGTNAGATSGTTAGTASGTNAGTTSGTGASASGSGTPAGGAAPGAATQAAAAAPGSSGAATPGSEGAGGQAAVSPSGPDSAEPTETANLTFPGTVIRGERRLAVPFVVISGAHLPFDVQLLSVRSADGTDLLTRPVTITVPAQGSQALSAVIELPAGTPLGLQEVPVTIELSSAVPVTPLSGTLSIEVFEPPAGPFGLARNAGWIILVVIILAALALLVFLAMRILRAGLHPAWARAVYLAAKEGNPLVEMVVTTQNRHIGLRNVRYLRPGTRVSVGGGRSGFLIYFVPVPPRMAVLKFDGRKYTFDPLKLDLFPSLSGPLQDCLGKEILAVSPRGYRFTIVFHRFLSPLEEINRLMRSVRNAPFGALPSGTLSLARPTAAPLPARPVPGTVVPGKTAPKRLPPR